LRQCAKEVAEIAGEHMQLQPDRIAGELAAGKTRPLDGVLALFSALLRRVALF
jgi:hypothetical protein